MILPLIADMPQHDLNMFDCISLQREIYVPAREVPVIDYLVSVFPRNENTNPFSFVYGLFQPKNKAIANNQDAILNIANIIFSDASPLDNFEQSVLNDTFKKSIKDKPTLSGRK